MGARSGCGNSEDICAEAGGQIRSVLERGSAGNDGATSLQRLGPGASSRRRGRSGEAGASADLPGPRRDGTAPRFKPGAAEPEDPAPRTEEDRAPALAREQEERKRHRAEQKTRDAIWMDRAARCDWDQARLTLEAYRYSEAEKIEVDPQRDPR